MNTFEMNAYDNNGHFTGKTITCNVLFYCYRTELRVVENNGVFYCVDCEGDAQRRGDTIPVGMHNARHAFAVYEFLAVEADYFG